MKVRTERRHGLIWKASMFMGLAFVSQCALAATPLFIFTGIGEQTNPDGSIEYFSGGSFSGLSSGRVNSLTSPTGVVFTSGPSQSTSFPTLAAAQQQLFGEWVFKSAPAADPANVEEYRFTVNPFGPADITATAPVVTPPNGALVHSPFVLTWDPPSSSYGFGSTGVLGAREELVQPGRLIRVLT